MLLNDIANANFLDLGFGIWRLKCVCSINQSKAFIATKLQEI